MLVCWYMGLLTTATCVSIKIMESLLMEGRLIDQTDLICHSLLSGRRHRCHTFRWLLECFIRILTLWETMPPASIFSCQSFDKKLYPFVLFYLTSLCFRILIPDVHVSVVLLCFRILWVNLTSPVSILLVQAANTVFIGLSAWSRDSTFSWSS